MKDGPRVGRLHTSQPPQNMVAVHFDLVTDRWLMIQMLVKKLHMDKEMVCKIITEDLGKKKLYVWYVPHALTMQQ